MKKLFKAALVVLTLAGFQVVAAAGASASDKGLAQYAKDPTVKEAMLFKPIKVAGRHSRRRSHRRNRNVVGGIFAAGIAAIIINEAVRSQRRNDRHYYNDRYYDDRSYGYRSSYRSHRRICRKWAKRCDWGNNRACRKWNKRCR